MEVRMPDGDDLPDHDYASIYGRAALQARRLARLAALLARQDEAIAQLQALRQRQDAGSAQLDALLRRQDAGRD
jgi:hypothetical protein